MSIEVRNVSVRYGARRVVQDVSFTCGSGTIVGILGPNGAGKTSLLKAMGGLVRCAGQVQYDRSTLGEMSSLDRARTVAYVPQRSLLDSGLSVRRVVRQGRYCHRGAWNAHPTARDEEAVERALQKVGGADLAARSFDRLSGGEQRRVLLARALATEARSILLDEPTASLDIAHSLTLFRTLRQLAEEGASIVCVLHDLSDAKRYCDQLLLLQGGRSQAFGSANEVVESFRIRQVYGVELVEGGALSFRLPEGA